MVLTIFVTIILSVIGFFSAGWVLPEGFDHECSGVWAPIHWSCHAKQVLAVSTFTLLPVSLFKNKVVVSLSTILTYIFLPLGIGYYFSGIFGRSPYFEAGYYMPSVYGIWIGFYVVLFIGAVSLMLQIFCPQFRRIGF